MPSLMDPLADCYVGTVFALPSMLLSVPWLLDWHEWYEVPKLLLRDGVLNRRSHLCCNIIRGTFDSACTSTFCVLSHVQNVSVAGICYGTSSQF